ncbi:MAG: NAD-dependent epimerase/dehydratase family protein [Saprospiraceae bacterium]|nr:NAD-dependent epimerase/dehydratase family protein [Saprospiraceae bacterium]
MRKGKKLFLTGATGMLGSHILDYLLQEPLEEIVAIHHQNSPTCSKENLTWIRADLLRPDTYEFALEGVDTVIHCAGLVSYSATDRNMLYRVNEIATSDLVDCCLHAGVRRIIYISSASTLSRSSDPNYIGLDALGDPVFTSEYAKSKYKAELQILRAEAEGMIVQIVHPALILGFGDWTEGSNAVFRRVHQGLRYYPAGKIGVCTAENTAKWIVHLIRHDGEAKQSLVYDSVVHYKDLFAWIAEGMGKKAPSTLIGSSMIRIFRWTDNVVSKIKGVKSVMTSETEKQVSTILSYQKANSTYMSLKREGLRDQLLRISGLYMIKKSNI